MSIWDDIGGLFTGDTYFPDNPSREHRVQELAQDCQNLAGQLSLQAPDLRQRLEKLNAQIAALYGRPEEVPSDVKPVEIEFSEWGVSVSQIVLPLLAGSLVSSALTLSATSYLAASGEIGAAAFAELVGLPLAFELSIGAAVGVAAIGISFAIGAIAGAVKRDQLQDAIHSGVRSRRIEQRAYLINTRLLASVAAISAAIAALHAQGLDTPAVIENVKEMVRHAAADARAVTEDDAQSLLANLDGTRRSWTNEDLG
ncbi:hypothetical protein [Deinococcus sp. Leaf326]|uniref:hypothetical protein n=1 Tax=Deinococcus sp. Leaf326 TaxID=1736338 RepID=UPI0006F5A744|nr:hypothetical protein [Deinococcus sp. Leaf326]KQR00151.1 hypothetical protein ASF71_21745 [Deinococcus sp. Leaf326]